MKKSQVSSAQKWSLASVGTVSSKGLESFFRTIPITGRDTRPGDPDLAHTLLRTSASALRIDNKNLLVGSSLTAAYDRLSIFGIGPSQNSSVSFQRCAVETQDLGSSHSPAAGYE